MEANEKAKKDISSQHCSPHWRKGATKSAGNRDAAKDIHGLDKAKRAEIEQIKFDKDHPVEIDPLFDGGE